MKKTTIRVAVGVTLAAGLTAVLVPASSAIGAGHAHAAPKGRTVDSATVKSFKDIAESVLTKRTTTLLDNRITKRIAPLPGGKVHLSKTLSHTEDTGLSSLRTRKSRLASLGEVYTASSTQTSVDKVSVKNDRATAQITETTTLTYKKVRGDEPATTGFQAHHELTFAASRDGKWEMTGIRSTDRGYRAVNEPVTQTARTAVTRDAVLDPPNGTPASTSWPGRAQPRKQTGTTGYDYAAMAAYAEKYWKTYNPAYRKFNNDGGDCTNFISQSLKAGGWKNASGWASDFHTWWYDPATTQSNSWVGADDWAWFTLSSKRATNLSNVYQLDIGDILQADWEDDGSKDHSMIVTYRSRSGMPYLTYHQRDTYRRSVASIVASYPDAVYYAYRT